jgi:hypothetical protein
MEDLVYLLGIEAETLTTDQVLDLDSIKESARAGKSAVGWDFDCESLLGLVDDVLEIDQRSPYCSMSQPKAPSFNSTVFEENQSISTISSHSTDAKMRNKASSMPLDQLFLQSCKCTCPYGGTCIQDCRLAEMIELKSAFWNYKSPTPPSATERRRKITEILTSAYVESTGKFVFSLKSNGNVRLVCEGAFLSILGYGTTDLSTAPRQWRDIKTSIVAGTNILQQDLKNETSERPNPQFRQCRAFISDFMEQCDPLPTAGGDRIRVVPFRHIKGLYEEFQVQCAEYLHIPADEIPSYQTFVRAWNSFNGCARLMRCKGNFSTCEVCSNASDLLSDPTRK